VKKIIASITAFVLALTLTACPSQNTLAALVTVVGNAAASVASIEGNSPLSQKLSTDTAALSKAVAQWKPGTNAQMAIEAAQLVEDDLNLFPQVSPYAPLISLALSTVISIIQILNPSPSPQITHTVSSAPKTAAEFKARWNTIALSNAQTANAAIK